MIKIHYLYDNRYILITNVERMKEKSKYIKKKLCFQHFKEIRFKYQLIVVISS